MRIILRLDENMFGCDLKVSDSIGDRFYPIFPTIDEILPPPEVTIEVFDSEFDLEVIPCFPDFDAVLRDFETPKWQDKIAKGAARIILSSFDKLILRVGCKYHIHGVKDGDRLDITSQAYAFGTFDRYDILELLPVSYCFFEVHHFTNRFAPTDAFSINRREFLRMSKKLALMDIGVNGIFIVFSYPIQIGRIKYLSRNKKIYNTLLKFHNMSDAERERILRKQESHVS